MGLELLVPHPPADPYPILALDPSTVAIGWAEIALPYLEKPPLACSEPLPACLSLDDRLAEIGKWLSWALLGLPRSPYGLVVVEVPDLSAATGQGLETTPETLRALWEAAGVIRECCRRAGVPMAQVDARRVRYRLVGLHGANKRAVQVTLKRRGYILPMRNGVVDHDAADALALGIAVQDEIEMMSHAQR